MKTTHRSAAPKQDFRPASGFWKALIIEDEPAAANLLKTLLREYCPQVRVMAEAGDVVEAVERIQMLHPDLVFVDIELRDGTVFEALDQLGDFRGHLIFTTGHDDFALRAFRYNAIDYLLKPIGPEALVEAVEKLNVQEQSIRLRYDLLRESVRTENFEKIVLSVSEEYHVVEVKEIIHISGEGNYSTVHRAQGKHIIVSKPLKFFEETLPADQFCRVHQSHMVNFACVKKVLKGDEQCILLENDEIIPLARRKKDDFMLQLRLFVEQT